MILGIIGGVGSGKTAVTDILKNRYGFEIFYTDKIATRLMAPGTPLSEELRKSFPEECFNDDGSINRRVYAGLIYSSDEMRRLSDSIVHPAVWKETERLIGSSGKNCCIETALPGSSLSGLCDEIWYVYADAEVRKERLNISRGYSREYSDGIIAGQMTEEEYMLSADYIIDNSGSSAETEERISELLNGRESCI